MEMPQAEPMSLDQKSLKMTATPLDGLNGKLEVNGHVSPVEVAPESKTENGVNHKGEMAAPGPTLDSKHVQNLGAFTANQSISADLPSESTGDAPLTKKAELVDPPKDVDMVDAPVEDVAARNHGDEAAEPERSAEVSIEPAVPMVPAVPTESIAPAEPDTNAESALSASGSDQPGEALAAAPTSLPDPSPQAKQDDADMEDAKPQPYPSSSADQINSTQNTAADDTLATSFSGDVNLHPASMSNLAIDVSQEEPPSAMTADTSMSDAPPQSSTKQSRERDEDDGDEPAAKRAKIDSPSGEPDSQPPTAQGKEVVGGSESVSLLQEDGKPKLLGDPSLDNTPITPYQSRQLRSVLALAKKTKAGANFRLPVSQLWPALIDSYMEKIDEPIDISTMEKKLRLEEGYAPYETMADFKRDIQLLYDNCVIFNGPNHDVTKSALNVKETIYNKMSGYAAVELPKTDKKESKHHPSRHTEPRAAAQQPQQQTQQQTQQQAPQQQKQQQEKQAQQAARRQSRGPAASPVEKPAVVEQPVETQPFAVPASGIPVIRRGSAKVDNDRPKRPVHPPKSKDIGFEPKKKKKLSPELRFCDEVLSELMKAKYKDFNGPFLQPVDPVAMKIPGYWSIVKKPMDLSTMQRQLYDGTYTNLKEFEKDFRQIVKNTQLFNGEDHEVTQQALKLQDIFEREWDKKDQWLAKHAPVAATTAAAQAAAASTAQAADIREGDSEEEEGNISENEEDPDNAQDLATLETMQKSLVEAQAKLNDLITAKRPDMALVEMQQGIVSFLQKSLVGHRTKMAEKEQEREKKAAPKPKPAKGKKAAAGGAGGGAGGRKSVGGTASAAGGNRKSGGGGGKKASAKNKIMGGLEKEVIAAGINDLDGVQLERAIDIIKKDTNQNASQPCSPQPASAPASPPTHSSANPESVLQENDSGELELDIEQLSNDALSKLYELITKAFPHLRAEKEKTFNPPPPPEPPAPKAKASGPKPKKNRPMGKDEQERRIAQLQELRAQIKRQGSGSQEPIPSVEQDGAGPLAPVEGNQPAANQDSDEESSEEE